MIAVDDPAFDQLQEVRHMTQLIRNHETAIREIAEQRQRAVIQLRKMRVRYRDIADAMNVTEQTIYKILQQAIKDRKQREAAEFDRVRSQ
jgi:DNA invertase Pin-like site-specific DNA recombinase